ncbi:MAG: helix-turn-helix domain-containing protein [Gammaproteobacteria bacterium]|nr:helix-turn-helix domain-containing protein [Gammaproteobacteria bacterium]
MIRRKSEQAVTQLLKGAGVRFASLREVSLATIRNTQRGAFPDMRMIDLAPNRCDAFLRQPILQDLLCTRVGYQGPSAAHYIPRPNGSRDHIIIFCTAGRGWLEMNGNEWSLAKNDAFLVPRGIPHAYGADPDQPWSNYWVHYRGRQGAAFAQLIGGSDSPVIHLQRYEEVVACIEQLYQYMGNMHARSELIAASGALSQLLCLIQFRMATAEPKGRTAEEGIQRSIDFMHKNLAKKLRLGDLANVAGMSPGHYGLFFRRSRDNTPLDYFNRLKIQKACELLKTTARPVGSIGESVGFTDPYYFSRMFRKMMGHSPRGYR